MSSQPLSFPPLVFRPCSKSRSNRRSTRRRSHSWRPLHRCLASDLVAFLVVALQRRSHDLAAHLYLAQLLVRVFR